jgi:hypothetical protein
MSDRKYRPFSRLVSNLGRRLAGHAIRLFGRDAAPAQTDPDDPREINRVIAGTIGRIRQAIGGTTGVLVRLAPQPMVIPGDTGDVDRILLDLVVNAREALDGKGVITIETELRQSFPDAGGTPGAKRPCLRLTVSDSPPEGAGAADHRQPTPRLEADEAEADTRLANVARVVQRLGGVLQIERRGSRTRTSIYLPLAPDPAATAPRRTP